MTSAVHARSVVHHTPYLPPSLVTSPYLSKSVPIQGVLDLFTCLESIRDVFRNNSWMTHVSLELL